MHLSSIIVNTKENKFCMCLDRCLSRYISTSQYNMFKTQLKGTDYSTYISKICPKTSGNEMWWTCYVPIYYVYYTQHVFVTILFRAVICNNVHLRRFRNVKFGTCQVTRSRLTRFWHEGILFAWPGKDWVRKPSSVAATELWVWVVSVVELIHLGPNHGNGDAQRVMFFCNLLFWVRQIDLKELHHSKIILWKVASK